MHVHHTPDPGGVLRDPGKNACILSHPHVITTGAIATSFLRPQRPQNHLKNYAPLKFHVRSFLFVPRTRMRRSYGKRALLFFCPKCKCTCQFVKAWRHQKCLFFLIQFKFTWIHAIIYRCTFFQACAYFRKLCHANSQKRVFAARYLFGRQLSLFWKYVAESSTVFFFLSSELLFFIYIDTKWRSCFNDIQHNKNFFIIIEWKQRRIKIRWKIILC